MVEKYKGKIAMHGKQISLDIPIENRDIASNSGVFSRQIMMQQRQ
jgi:hypothetical protein